MATPRIFETPSGSRWEAFAAEEVVAHGRHGAVLAFRRAGSSDQGLRSTITFNSFPAADLALRTLSVKELRRRLDLTRLAGGA